MTSSQASEEYSSGGVVYRAAGESYEIVVVNRARHTDWSLPKGHIESGETREQAAVREVSEEAGIDARVTAPIGEIVYFFRKPKGQLVRKSVYYFLMEATSFELGGPNWEVAESRWIRLEEASTILTYNNDRGIVRQAAELLAQSSEAAS